MAKTNYAEIAAGFIQRFGFIGPLMNFAAPFLKITALIKIKNPDKTIFIDLGAIPTSIVVDGPQRQADLTLTVDAEMFHYMLWGKVTFTKAMNDSLVLMEIKTGSLPDMPVFEAPETEPSYNNPIYEMYLINIGASHLLEEPLNIHIPLPLNPPAVRVIEIGPKGGSGILEKASLALSYTLGFIAGLALRVFLKFWKPPEFKPPKVRYLSLKEVYNLPAPPTFKPRSGTKFAVMKSIFSRLDMIRVIETGASGLNASGALKNPLMLIEPMNKALMLQLKQGA